MSVRNKGIKVKYQMKQFPTTVKNIVSENLPKHLTFSQHALDQQNGRKFHYTINECEKYVTIENLLEVQVTTKNTIKYLFRVNVNPIFDLVFVVSENGKIITNWLNSVNDHHATLKEKYLYSTSTENLTKLYS